MDGNEQKEAEAIVAQNLAGTTAHPPLLAPTEVKQAALGEVPPPVQRSTSSLSTEHLLPATMNDRKTGVRAWLHEMGVAAKSNYFGVRQRMHASHVAAILRQAPPEEQTDVLRTIESNLNYKDSHTVAALYTIACSNHELPQFKETHQRICRIMETLPVSIVAEVRDLIDRTSEGRGFLPLVLTGGMEHYKLLASKFSAQLTEGYLPPHRCVKIFSDIDDTVIANWVDIRGYSRYKWEPKTIYPGVRELHKQIIAHANNPSNKSVDLVFLSARPLRHQLLTIDALKSCGFGVPYPGNFTVLYGEFWSNLKPRNMGLFKYEMFKLYSGLYPNMDYVFFGDSGQGDYHCGELMIRDMKRGSSRLRGVFMHEIRAETEIFRQVDLSTPTDHLHYFYHYGHAAKQVLDEGLISQDGYDKVVSAFIKESREVAAAHLGDRASILATFQENPVSGGAPAQISKPPDVSKTPLQHNA